MRTQITLVVNDTVHFIAVDLERTLLSVLRDELGLTGAKYGCGHGKCGVCTLLVDGQPVQACGAAATGAVQVLHVVEAFEWGAVINPENVRAQVEAAVIQGLGGARFERVRFANGRILNPDFAGYRVPRFADIPRIQVVLLDRKEIPSVGAGETPIIAVAPGIANAVFQATGRRLCSLPPAPDGLLPGAASAVRAGKAPLGWSAHAPPSSMNQQDSLTVNVRGLAVTVVDLDTMILLRRHDSIDSIILATARAYDAALWTQDGHLESVEGVHQYIARPFTAWPKWRWRTWNSSHCDCAILTV